MSEAPFDVVQRSANGLARTGRLHTAHGTVETPAFVPVATRGTIKGVEPDALRALGAQVMICNSYHLHLAPGEEVIADLGGLHRFTGWAGPMMTDSGGFQVFSLGAGKAHGVGKVASVFPDEAVGDAPRRIPGDENSLVRLGEDGVEFRSILDGSWHRFSPESVVTLQRRLGPDIALVLDECTSPLHDYHYTKAAMERPHRWAERALAAFAESDARGQMLFGIVQGGAFRDLREESARTLASLDFPGLAIGGSLGRSKAEMHAVLDWTVARLPEGRPRHLLGIGEIEDIFAAVRRGVDSVDCASATRIARNGSVFLRGAPRHRINLRNAAYRDDPAPIDASCDCFTCRHHSRAYLRHLYRSGELSFARLATIHNLRTVIRLMASIREAIAADALDDLAREWDAGPPR
ncbi:MAG: tRNA guanosine(34) transglycosylase Tgt [Candidatus Bipolaricaulota bacterium]|nr:MAG: tRNA guanosine(34) transglycosylase Tgt [Candidatus Bipolaricaulota bacterium]